MTEKQEGKEEWGAIIQRYKDLFNSQTMSDIQFSFGDTERAAVYAHKVILGAASDVFKSMFYGDLKETTDVIDIPDISKEVFLEIIRFIYYGEVDLTPENVLEIFYASKKYQVPGLGEKCRKYLDENMDSENVCTILDASLKFDEEPLKEKCLEIIRTSTANVFASEAFLGISNESLGLILDQDELEMQSEVDVFKAVERWARQECKRQDIPISGDNMRKVIGDNIYKLRLLHITAEELGEHISPSDILNPKEVKDILECIVIGKACAEPKFNIKVRMKHNEYVCRRYTNHTIEWDCQKSRYDAIKFTTDKEIMLTGLGVFVPHKATSYNFKTSVQVLDNTNKVVYDVQHNFTQDDVKQGDVIQKLKFNKKVKISAKQEYSVKVLLNGPHTYKSSDMRSPVTVENVTFTFENHPDSTNYTKVTCGQLPCLYFKH